MSGEGGHEDHKQRRLCKPLPPPPLSISKTASAHCTYPLNPLNPPHPHRYEEAVVRLEKAKAAEKELEKIMAVSS